MKYYRAALQRHNEYKYHELKVINGIVKVINQNEEMFDDMLTKAKVPIEKPTEPDRYLNARKVIKYFSDILERHKDEKT